jgi:hypothetical protein
MVYSLAVRNHAAKFIHTDSVLPSPGVLIFSFSQPTSNNSDEKSYEAKGGVSRIKVEAAKDGSGLQTLQFFWKNGGSSSG